MTTKAVTIIIPVYNAGSNIERCLDSLLAQTSSEFEALFIDDGSTDDSLTRLRAAETEHPEVFRVLTQENRGVCETRHRGIREAQTEFVMFMDQDDYIDADYVETLLSAIRKRKADIVISGCRRTDGKRTLFQILLSDSPYSKYIIITPWARIFRRSLLVENDIRFLETVIGEDIYFNLTAFLYTDRVVTLPYIGYNWYMNPQSVSNTRQNGLQEDCDLLVLLNALDKLYAEKDARTIEFDYFVYRMVCRHILWSGKTASRERFLEECRRLFTWTDEHGYYPRMLPFDRRIRADKLFNRLVVSAFDVLRRLRLVSLFAALYCRG